MSIFAGEDPFWVAKRGTVTNGLVGHWDSMVMSAADRAGNRWLDLSGNGNHGTLIGGASFDRIGCNFDGVNDLVSISASQLPSGSTPWTICLWEYPTSFANFGTSISWGTTGGINFQSIIVANNPDGRLLIGQFGRDVLTTTTTRPINTWTHTTIIYLGGTTLQAYQNGLQNGGGTISNAFSITLTTAAIGRIQDPVPYGPQQYTGQLDDIRVYNRALSAAEISRNFNATRARFGV
jgi:hypothetical protein